MADSDRRYYTAVVPWTGIGWGVWWYVWGTKGFWWGVVYGMFWPIIAGFRFAAWMGW